MLKDFGHSGAAMELVKRRFTGIIRLVDVGLPILRPPIAVSMNVKDGLVYFGRKLNVFKTEDTTRALYVEINFVCRDNIYSISLSRALNGDCFVVS
jgi:hypothetical protein